MPGYSSQQHVGYVDAATLAVSLCLTYTVCIACVRLWIRKGAYGYDDLVVLIATIITLGHAGCSYLALANGLGQPWTALSEGGKLGVVNDASIAGVVTFLLALYISKLGVLAFLSRIQSHAKNRLQLFGYYTCAALFGSFGIVSILIATVDCVSASGYYWAISGNRESCPSQSARWQVITALDVVTEILLLVLPVQLIWNLQMPRTKKGILLIAFYLRAPVVALSLARDFFTRQLRLPQSDPGKDSAIVVIWLEVQLAYALASSTLSALKAFTESFNSGWGLGFTRDKTDSNYVLSSLGGKSGSSNATAKSEGGATTESAVTTDDKRLSQLQALRYEDTRVIPTLPSTLTLRPDRGNKHVATVVSESSTTNSVWRHGCAGRSSSHGSEDDMVILRETELSVQHDRAPMLRS